MADEQTIVLLAPGELALLASVVDTAFAAGDTIRLWIDSMDGGVKIKLGNQSWSPALGRIEVRP